MTAMEKEGWELIEGEGVRRRGEIRRSARKGRW